MASKWKHLSWPAKGSHLILSSSQPSCAGEEVGRGRLPICVTQPCIVLLFLLTDPDLVSRGEAHALHCPPTHPHLRRLWEGLGRLGRSLSFFILVSGCSALKSSPSTLDLSLRGLNANLTFRILDIRGPHLFIFVALRAQHELTHRSHSINVCWKKVGRQKEEWEESVVLSL